MPKVILYGYPASPYYQKLVSTLAFLKIEYSVCSQPNALPRPDFESIGVSYRRIPLLSIDGDLYCDTSLIISKLCELANTPNHRETEALGASMFTPGAMLIPYNLIADEKFLKDRSELTGRPWTKTSITAQRVPALSAFISNLAIVEELLKNNGTGFIRGNAFSTADIHLLFLVQWVLFGHKGSEPEVSPKSHPTIYEWIKKCNAALPKQKPAKIAFSEAKTFLINKGLDGQVQDVLPFKAGMQVSVAPLDTGRKHPQVGSLVLLNSSEVAVKTSEGVTIHFPRLGYMIKAEAKM